MHEKMADYIEYREQIDKLNESSLQTFYTLLLNKTIFVVRQIGKELQEANTTGFIKKNEKLALARDDQADVFSSIPKKWKNNQIHLNNFTHLELELFIFIIRAKDILRDLHSSLQKQIGNGYMTYLQNIEAAKNHSTQIFHDTLVDASQQLDVEKFEEDWSNALAGAMKELKSRAREVVDKIDLVDRTVFDDFKSSQFKDHRAVTLRARKLVGYVLQQDFISPIEGAATETMEWFENRIQNTLEVIGQSIAVLGMLKSDSVKATALPQLTQSISILEDQLQEAEINKLRLLNQVMERSNALADKFSLNAVTRRKNVFKKFIR